MNKYDVLSFGAGVQSTALLLMACDGTLKKLGYNIENVVFANTGDEPKRVLDHFYKMKEYAENYGLNVFMVRNGNIIEDVKNFCATGKRLPMLPFFTRDIDTGVKGMMMRQCTTDYKIIPVNRKSKLLIGITKGKHVPKDTKIRKLIGISVDEYQRIKLSPNKWEENCYPLFDMGYDRLKCMQYIENILGYIPPSSECIICPFHSDEYWRNMKLNYKEDWEHAVSIDELLRSSSIQNKTNIKSKLYLYRRAVPLKDAQLNEGQQSLFDNFCGGGCGL